MQQHLNQPSRELTKAIEPLHITRVCAVVGEGDDGNEGQGAAVQKWHITTVLLMVVKGDDDRWREGEQELGDTETSKAMY